MSEVYSVIGLKCQWFTVSGVFRSLVYNIIGFTVYQLTVSKVYSVSG